MSSLFHSPIFVLGLPRSGTSMVAGALNICGAWTGSTVPGGEQNPKGFFEHTKIREQVTKNILIGLGYHPSGVIKLPPINLSVDPNKLLSIYKKIVTEYKYTDLINNNLIDLETIIRVILKSDGYNNMTNQSPWLYKDAKLSLLWPLFNQAFPKARWLIVRRDEESFIKSCLRTNFMKFYSQERDFWVKYAQEYNAHLDVFKENVSNVLEVYTPDLISGNFDDLKTTALSLGLNYPEDKLREFISPEHWHGKSTD